MIQIVAKAVYNCYKRLSCLVKIYNIIMLIIIYYATHCWLYCSLDINLDTLTVK